MSEKTNEDVGIGEDNITRRSAIKTAGIGLLASSGFVSNGLGGPDRSKTQYDNVFEKLLEQNEKLHSDRINELLEEEGVSFDLSSKKLGETNDDGISIQARYSESDAEITVVAVPDQDHDDRVTIGNTIYYGGATHHRERKPWNVPDIIGITYNSDHWTEVGEPGVGSPEHDTSWYSGSVGDDALAAEVDLETERTSWYRKVPVRDTHTMVWATLELQDDTPATAWGHYSHTSAYTSYSSVSITADIGVLEAEVDLAGYVPWEMYEPVDPDPDQ